MLSASDEDGNALTFAIVSQPAKGGVSITNASTGAFTYAPNANVNGNDSFTFKVNDGLLDSNTATISITIVPQNDAPVASGGSLAMNEDTPATGVLIATDLDGNALSFAIVTQPAKGGVVITNASTGAFIYTPNANVNGSDSFTFKVNDGSLDSNTATISITTHAQNDAPVASGGSLEVNEHDSYSGQLNASDVDGNTLVFILETLPAKGNVVITNPTTGTFTYTPIGQNGGSDLFTFKVNDGTLNSTTASVSIVIHAVNDAPTLSGIPSTGVAENVPYQFIPTGSDPENDPLSYSIQNKPSWASFNIATGALTGTPGLHDQGSYNSIILTLSDGDNFVSLAAFNITVANVNAIPTISDIVNQNGKEDERIGPIPVTLGDPDSPNADDLILTATSSNTELIPQDNAHGSIWIPGA